MSATGREIVGPEFYLGPERGDKKFQHVAAKEGTKPTRHERNHDTPNSIADGQGGDRKTTSPGTKPASHWCPPGLSKIQ
jgi:hypothetical protein